MTTFLKNSKMQDSEKIQEAYRKSADYPSLVKKLVDIGVLSYTVQVATGITLYRIAEGVNILHDADVNFRDIEKTFDRQKTVAAVQVTQQGKTTYPQFLEAIAQAGVQFYEATLNGKNRRVTYIGNGGQYEEAIPF
jgi:uncharacterized protein YbcV (DUF1398 family)